MPRPVTIGVVGDRNPGNPTHLGTEESLRHVGNRLGVDIRVVWKPTANLVSAAERKLSDCQGLIVSPGSPYQKPQGALNAIRWARETDVPVLGTCGGFQHIIIECARNVLGVADAAHAEEQPDAAHLYVTPLSCSLVGQTEGVTLMPGSRAFRVYGQGEVRERFYCNFGLNPAHRSEIEAAGLHTSGVDKNGEVRIMELSNHRFCFGTLFVPQMSSTRELPHPLVLSLVSTAAR